MRVQACICFLVAGFAAILGCEKPAAAPVVSSTPSTTSPAPSPESIMSDLKEIQMMAFLYRLSHEAQPTSLKDLEPFAGDKHGGLTGLKERRYVIRFDFRLDGRVLAFEKEAPEQGGWVVLGNGEVKKMTRAEFDNAW